MSQSPDGSADESATSQLVSYRNAWTALSQLIGKGHSFSGHERNCCFLNTGSGRFADVSAATGLDLIDDGRAVAAVDWDFDGAIDLWVANRTAPRVRLLRNQLQTDHHWLALRLQGKTCNRDAIGARLELYLQGPPPRRLIKTLHAGDGYLSQSSKWVHFGLGQATKIDHLVVAWPGGERETITQLTADRRYRLIQGSGRAELWTPPRGAIALDPSPIEIPSTAPETRTWIMGRVPLPTGVYLDWRQTPASIDDQQGQPLLINLWSRNCGPCIKELSEWAGQYSSVNQSGLRIMALCVDALDPSQEDVSTTAQDLLERLEWPFLSGLASSSLVDSLEIIQRTFLEFQQPLPVPCSFLLDRWGRVAAIYKGRLNVSQLLRDVRLLDEPRSRQRDAAVPLAGRFASEVFPSDPMPIVRTLEVAERKEEATNYLRRYIQMLETHAADDGFRQGQPDGILVRCYKSLGEKLLHHRRLSEAEEAFGKLLALAPVDGQLHGEVAHLMLVEGQARSALPHFRIALDARPNDPTLLHNVALAEMSLRKIDDAIGHFQAALKHQPNDAATHFHLANAFQNQGQTTTAIMHYRHALRLNPAWSPATNNLAWILATHQDASIRNGPEALRFAEQMCASNKHRDPTMLATLAAAQAEVGRFQDAAKTNQTAIQLAEKTGSSQLVQRLTARQRIYESGRAYRSE